MHSVPRLQVVIERGSSWTPGADWHLDQLSVTDLARGVTYIWRCGSWLSQAEGMAKGWAAAGGGPGGLKLVDGPPGASRVLTRPAECRGLCRMAASLAWRWALVSKLSMLLTPRVICHIPCKIKKAYVRTPAQASANNSIR